MMRCAVVMLAVVGCVGPSESETTQEIFNNGSTPLQLLWMKGSHNTYETANTPDSVFGAGSTIASHLGVTTNHIEIDLRDTHQEGLYPQLQYTGNWIVSHNLASPLTTKCGAGSSFSACLAQIDYFHTYHPGHSLIVVWLDKKQDWENLNANASSRSPWRLDDIISQYFTDTELFRPADWVGTAGTLRNNVLGSGWPTYGSLANKVMFVLAGNEPSNCTGNDRLEAYAVNRGSAAKAFIAPSGAGATSYVIGTPECFGATATGWTAFYDFEWTSSSSGDECDSDGCFHVPNAHDRNFLVRVHDIDDAGESDAASAQPRRGIYGHANFIPIDHPWQQFGTGGFGSFPDGSYPW